MNYHGHVYYDKASKTQASELQQRIIEDWPEVSVYPLIDRRVGPHPCSMFEIDFNEKDYIDLKNYLEKFRNNLSVLIHPLMEDELRAHTSEAVWLGIELELFTEVL